MARTRLAAWEDIVLRIIAIYKILHGLFFVGIGVGLVKLKRVHDLPAFVNDYVIRPLQLPPESSIVDWALTEAAKVTPHTLTWTSDAVFFYALLFLIEGVGLYLRKHWAEYFVIIVSGSLLPFEIWSMVVHAAWWKGGIIIGNLLIVGYLIHRLQLDFKRAHEGPSRPEAPAATASLDRTQSSHPVSNGR